MYTFYLFFFQIFENNPEKIKKKIKELIFKIGNFVTHNMVIIPPPICFVNEKYHIMFEELALIIKGK